MDSVAVIGAGTMGRGIAYVAIAKGLTVALHDTSAAALDQAREEILALIDKGVRRGTLAADVAAKASERLTTTTTLADAVTGRDAVVENVVEDLDVKRQVLTAIESHTSSTTLVATNTSALSIDELAQSLEHADRYVGMHFFNPVHAMALCEVIRGDATSQATVEAASALARRLGKTPVVVRDSPGFLATRINCLVGNEAMRMLDEGIASAADIDEAVRLGLRYPMGPLELADLVGLDVRLAALRTLHERLGDRYRPARCLEELVAAGHLGRKTGRGFFTYDATES